MHVKLNYYYEYVWYEVYGFFINLPASLFENTGYPVCAGRRCTATRASL